MVPEDRIAKDTRRATDWLRWLEVTLVAILIIALVLTLVSVKSDSRQASQVAQDMITHQVARFDTSMDKFDILLDNLNLRTAQMGPLLDEGKIAIKKFGDAGAAFGGVAVALRTSTIPGVNEEMASLKGATDNLGGIVKHTDVNLNNAWTGLIPTASRTVSTLAKTAAAFNVSLGVLNAAIQRLSDETGQTVDAILKRINDPKWDAFISNIVEFSKNWAEFSKQLPDIAKNLKKISDTTSVGTKVLYVLRSIALFLPLLGL